MTNSIEHKINQAADSVEPSTEFTQKLWSQIKMSPNKAKEPKRINRWVWIPAATVLGLLLILIISAPQTVLAAVKGLLSYLPGTGFVQNSDSTLYLAEPVVATQGAYTFTVDQVVANSEKVVVSYHMDGLPSSAASCMYDDNHLLLSDGKTSLPIGGGAEGVTARVEFAPLPEGVNQASIKAAMNFKDPNCSSIPQEWNVAFSLGTKAPVSQLLPVIENTVTQGESETSSTGSSVQMIVDRFVELPTGYLLTGHMVISNTDWRNVIIDFDSISALDANGKSVSVLPSDESFGDNEFSLMIADKDFVGPINIKIKSLWVKANDAEDLAFLFDAGKDPQIGQSWTINKELSVAKKKVFIQTVKMVENDSHNNQPSTIQGYSIQVKSEDMNNAGINCVGQQGVVSHFGQTRPLDSKEFLLENFYPDSIPTGAITCKLQDVQFKEAGEWSFEWQPVTAAK